MIKRYDLQQEYGNGVMEERDNGDYVKYEDYAFMECAADYEAQHADEMKAERDRLQAEVQELRVLHEACKSLVRARGRFHTEASYKMVAATLEAMKEIK